MDAKFLSFRRLAKVRFQPETTRSGGMHGWIAHFVARLAKCLGAGHRGICIAEHVLRRAIATAAESDADARGCEDRLPIDIEGRLYVLLNSFRHPNSFAGIPDVIQQDGELVASQSRQYAGFLQLPSHPALPPNATSHHPAESNPAADRQSAPEASRPPRFPGCHSLF